MDSDSSGRVGLSPGACLLFAMLHSLYLQQIVVWFVAGSSAGIKGRSADTSLPFLFKKLGPHHEAFGGVSHPAHP